nr:RHS repeat domain-containing protein [Streptomyces oryzae]
MGRVTAVHARGWTERYTYDEAGRITLRQKPRLSKKPDTWRHTWDAPGWPAPHNARRRHPLYVCRQRPAHGLGSRARRP